MVRRGQVIEDGALHLEVLATAADTDGALHEMRARYAPRSPFPPAHHHPSQGERFVVEEGALVFEVDGLRRVVAAGESIDVPPRAVHRVRNAGDVPAVARWETRPALRTGELLEQVADARARGGVLDLLAVVAEHRDVYRLAVRPRWVTGPAVTVVGRAARVVRSRR